MDVPHHVKAAPFSQEAVSIGYEGAAQNRFRLLVGVEGRVADDGVHSVEEIRGKSGGFGGVGPVVCCRASGKIAAAGFDSARVGFHQVEFQLLREILAQVAPAGSKIEDRAFQLFLGQDLGQQFRALVRLVPAKESGSRDKARKRFPVLHQRLRRALRALFQVHKSGFAAHLFFLQGPFEELSIAFGSVLIRDKKMYRPAAPASLYKLNILFLVAAPEDDRV